MQLDEAKQRLLSAMLEQPKQILSTYHDAISNIGTTPVYLYGAGAFGRQLFHLFAENGVAVQGFVDRNAKQGQTLCGVAVYSPNSADISDEKRSCSTLMLSIVMTLEDRVPLLQTLNKLGFLKVIDGQSIIAAMRPFSADRPEANWGEHGLSEKICAAAALFEDEESREIYALNLRAHILRNYEDCAESRESCQYFHPKGVPFSKGYARFVDCGAYIGDTLLELTQMVDTVETYIGFEPDHDNFERLAATAASLSMKPTQTFLYPCATGGMNRISAISGDKGAGALSVTGENMVKVVRLDDTLVGFAPTFIKMDIEGAETEALQGSENLIRTHHPDLAVCVYHNISDFFEIPLMLHRWNSNYCFYLRTHSSCTMETVLYVTERG